MCMLDPFVSKFGSTCFGIGLSECAIALHMPIVRYMRMLLTTCMAMRSITGGILCIVPNRMTAGCMADDSVNFSDFSCWWCLWVTCNIYANASNLHPHVSCTLFLCHCETCSRDQYWEKKTFLTFLSWKMYSISKNPDSSDNLRQSLVYWCVYVHFVMLGYFWHFCPFLSSCQKCPELYFFYSSSLKGAIMTIALIVTYFCT